MREQVIDLQDVQGLVRGYGRTVPIGKFLLLKIGDPDGFREFLTKLGPPTTMEEWPDGDPPETATNIAFTYKGLEALALPAALLETFPSDFAQGMGARKAINFDLDDSDPQHWESCWRDRGVHVWIGVYAKGDTALQKRIGAIKAIGVARRAFSVVHEEEVGLIAADSAGCPPNAVQEHFGFVDGLSDPAIEGVSRPQDYAGSKKSFAYPASGWLPLAPGEFLLGHYKDEADERPVGPAMLELATNGTFMVYRKLQQKVADFRLFLDGEAQRLGVDADDIAARMVGRERNGSPLVHTNGNGSPGGGRDLNAFDYSSDPDGRQCPLGAHIRRANPRDSLGFGTVLVDRHRMLRRGIPYGPPLPPQTNDDGKERGLVFIALNASIARQFEFVQKRWMNDGNDFNVGEDRDPIAGNHHQGGSQRFVMNASRGDEQGVAICGGLRNFVTTRGGDYFFLPGLGALRYLAEGSYHL